MADQWQQPDPSALRPSDDALPAAPAAPTPSPWAQGPPPGYPPSYGPPGYGPPSQVAGYGPPANGGYGWPSPYQQPWTANPPRPGNGLATASLVLGIIFLLIFFAGVLTFIGSMLAIIFGGVGVSRATRLGGEGRGRATAGLVLGILAMLLYLTFGLLSLGIGWFV